jgi:hypothetical protein
MAIITISRELAALGDETAHELSKHLGYKFIDRDAIEKRIRLYGVAQGVLDKYDERRPGFFASLSSDRDDYLHYLKLAVVEEAKEAEGKCIFVGRGAYAIFANFAGAVPVFLVLFECLKEPKLGKD